MGRHYHEEQSIFSSKAAVSATFTANVNNTITSTAHGLSNGNVITVANSGGALPTGLSASTYYYIISAATDTFEVSTTVGGSAVDITGAGSGTNTWYQEFEGTPILIPDYQFAVVTFNTSGSANVTLKCVGAISSTPPTFLNAQSTTNRYDFIQMLDYEDWNPLDGDTGLAFAAADDQRLFRVNFDGLMWLNFKTLNFKAGTLNVRCKVFSND